MRPEDRDEARLWDMLASCERLAQMRSTVTLAEVLDSDDLQDIALRRLTVLGEAARQVSPEAKARWANVPWSSVVALRNLVVHEYAHADLEIIWDILAVDLPELQRQLSMIIGKSR